MNRENEFKNFQDFWPFYLAEHQHPLNRKLHFIGIAAILPIIILAVLLSAWLLLAIPFVVYGLAWYGHFNIEKNKPASFKYPAWSMLGDFKMFWLTLSGNMDEEITRLKNNS